MATFPPAPVLETPVQRQELNGQLAAMKIPGWWHDLVSLTHVDSNICVTKFNSLSLRFKSYRALSLTLRYLLLCLRFPIRPPLGCLWNRI
ncbi:hypothetical protein Taro_021856 [Colocasia esculenta]|uniref:Uncharacterized protein n=1 Tax=Colocasia esculenta TaxID=4460 RepID=A0A843USR1_COLES|nr:hypothetical protein [Colocasia esculenta]